MANKVYLVCFSKPTKEHIYDELINIFVKNDIRNIYEDKVYTHVGLTYEPNEEQIMYYACRYDFGVGVYVEDRADVDIFEIPLRYGYEPYIDEYFDLTEDMPGSFLKDINQGWLENNNLPLTPRPHDNTYSHGSVEWVARALDLGFPERYTIKDLIRFAKEENAHD